MNNDLISRSALLANISAEYDLKYGEILIDPRNFDEMVYFAPAVDAVEVVRCKDCVHWLNEDGIEDHVCLKIYNDAGVHSVAWQNRKPDDFCSYGERRADGEIC